MPADMRKQKAVWSANDTLKHVELDVEEPQAGEVLIRNVCVASNPKDYKFPRWLWPSYEAVEGNDIAGIVESVGEGVTLFKRGDRVGALTKQKTHHRYGAYQQYSIAPASSVFRLSDATSFEDAATLPLSFSTAALALFQQLGLPLPADGGTPLAQKPQPTLIVHSAASTVGFYATQLARLAGYRVVGVAGSGADLARSAGCSEVVDYRGRTDEDIAGDLQRHAHDAQLAIDCVSAGSSVALLAAALQPHGGHICTLLPTRYDHHDSSANVSKAIGKVRATEGDAEDVSLPANIVLKRALIYDAHGCEEAMISQLLRNAAKWIENGSFRTMPVRLIQGGLHGVPAGLELLEQNKVSAAKLVYRIADTPGL